MLKYGDRVCRVPAGSAFVCNTTDPSASYFYPQTCNENWKFIYAEMSGPQIKTIVSHLMKQNAPVISCYQQPEVVIRLNSFSRFRNRNCLLSASESNSIVSTIGQLLIENLEDEMPLPSGDIISSARAEVIRSLEQPITVNELAEWLNVSREHLSRTFTKLTGISPHRFILEKKISFAAKLLRNTTLSCKEISVRLGFRNQALFSENFKRIKGVAPSVYRQITK